MTHNWDPKKYAELVEGNLDATFRKYMQDEIRAILNVENRHQRTFVDIGAGYGRILPYLESAGKVIAVEMDADMFRELERRATMYGNAIAIQGDAKNLDELLQQQRLVNPVVMILQNTLGTVTGDWRNLLFQAVAVAKANRGDILLSIFCQEALADWGIDFYRSLEEMVGEIDNELTQTDAGIFVSKTGYVSKWWTAGEREELRKMIGGKMLQEIGTGAYKLFHAVAGIPLRDEEVPKTC